MERKSTTATDKSEARLGAAGGRRVSAEHQPLNTWPGLPPVLFDRSSRKATSARSRFGAEAVEADPFGQTGFEQDFHRLDGQQSGRFHAFAAIHLAISSRSRAFKSALKRICSAVLAISLFASEGKFFLA
jgi:hypothetical protein